MSAIDRHRKLADPVGQDALDVGLPEREKVVVASREIADVESGIREGCSPNHLPLRNKAMGDPALVENFDGPWVQTACAQPGEVLAGRRSTMATSTPANIIPVGPPPAITTACSVNNKLMSLLLFQKALASAKSPADASDSKTHAGSCRKFPGALFSGYGREEQSTSFRVSACGLSPVLKQSRPRDISQPVEHETLLQASAS